jgi:hypothetical protein
MTILPKFLTRRAAAEYVQKTWGLPCSPKTLAKYAVIGGGPIFQKAGRVPLYRPTNLDDWAENKIGEPVRSTSELSAFPINPPVTPSQKNWPARGLSPRAGQIENIRMSQLHLRASRRGGRS